MGRTTQKRDGPLERAAIVDELRRRYRDGTLSTRVDPKDPGMDRLLNDLFPEHPALPDPPEEK